MAAQLPERAPLPVPGGCLGSLPARLRQRYAEARQRFEAVDAVDGPQAGHFRFRQLSAILQLTPLILVAQLLYVVIVCTLFWGAAPRPLLMGWSVLMVSAGLGIGYYWQLVQLHGVRQISRRSLARTTRMAAFTGMLWACVPAVLFQMPRAMRSSSWPASPPACCARARSRWRRWPTPRSASFSCSRPVPSWPWRGTPAS